jgi:hypothetical protein
MYSYICSLYSPVLHWSIEKTENDYVVSLIFVNYEVYPLLLLKEYIMDNQEMQFADPAWQPPHQRDNTMQARQPVSTKPGEQSEQQAPLPPQQTPAPDRDTGAYAPGYAGYRQQQSAQIRPARRGRRSPSLTLIIIAFILLALLGGGYQMYANNQVPTGYQISTGLPPLPLNETRQFSVGIHPTIVITNNFGFIHVHTGGPDDNVTLQISRTQPAAINTNLGNDGSLHITVNKASSPVDLDVTIANEADLVLQTADGDINVDGVSGQVTLTSAGGSINLTQATLARTSTVKTTGGDITFLGTITPQGNYQFESDNGTMNISLPDSASYHLDVTQKDGTFNTDLPIVAARDSSGDVQTNVGTSPNATVVLKTATGSINLMKQ